MGEKLSLNNMNYNFILSVKKYFPVNFGFILLFYSWYYVFMLSISELDNFLSNFLYYL